MLTTKKRPIRRNQNKQIYPQPNQFVLGALEKRFEIGKSFEKAGSFGDAENVYRELVGSFDRLRLNSATPNAALGFALLSQGKHEEAEKVLKRSLAQDAALLEAHINLGAIYRLREKWKETEAACKRALAIDPKDIRARLNLAFAEAGLQKYGAAVQSFLLILSLDPNHIDARKGIAQNYVALGETEVSIPMFRKVLEMEPDSLETRTQMLFAMQYDPVAPLQSVFEEHLEFGKIARENAGPPCTHFENSKVTERVLRIGYYSGDFKYHVVMRFAENVLSSHDPSRVEVHCISTSDKSDSVTERIKAKFPNWHSIAGKEDAEAAEFVRQQKIDVLVDLGGHTSMPRLALLARRLAPVQATWCGYSGTTGLDTMDYILVDKIIAPPEEQHYFTETPFRLPHSYLSFVPANPPEVSPLPYSRNGYVTFGCMNNPSKVNRYVVGWWAQILKAVPDSKLVMRYHLLGDPLVKERLARLFRAADIPLDRVHMEEGGKNFLQGYADADIALDTFPYNGTTTTCEALWMGVPVITLYGDRFVARVGASLLANTGLSNLIATSPEDYVQRAVELARQPENLADIRGRLRAHLGSTPVYDPKSFAKGLEDAYFEMFKNWANK